MLFRCLGTQQGQTERVRSRDPPPCATSGRGSPQASRTIGTRSLPSSIGSMASLINRPVRPAVRQSIGPWHNSGRQHGLTCHGRVLFYSHASTCSSGSHTWRVSHLGVAAPSFCAGPFRHLQPSVRLCVCSVSAYVCPSRPCRASRNLSNNRLETTGCRRGRCCRGRSGRRLPDASVCVSLQSSPRHRLCTQFRAATVLLFCSQVQSANRALCRCPVSSRRVPPIVLITRAPVGR